MDWYFGELLLNNMIIYVEVCVLTYMGVWASREDEYRCLQSLFSTWYPRDLRY